MNLGRNCGDEASNVEQNHKRLRTVLPAPAQWLKQVHGATVVRHPGKAGEELQADAVVSFQPGRVCAVLTADCLPVFFCSRSGDRVAVAHAGWRGLAGGILQATIKSLGLAPENLLAWMGPAIGPEAYEVGPELAEAFPAEFPAGFTCRGNRYLLDLYTLAKMKLNACGLESIHGGGFCTLSDPDRFYSYRRDRVTGRMASLIWLEDGAAGR
jgi:YfiH family protein